MPDVIAPLAAAIITKGVGTPEERVALTAAAAFIEGPMALVPAVVRLQRAKEEGKSTTTTTTTAGGSPILPALVPVPNVEGKTEAEAIEILDKAKLKYARHYHVSDEKDKDRVMQQQPKFGSPPVTEGTTTITLSIGAGRTLDEEDPDRDEELRKEMKSLGVQIAGLSNDIKRLEEAAKLAINALPPQGTAVPVPPNPTTATVAAPDTATSTD